MVEREKDVAVPEGRPRAEALSRCTAVVEAAAGRDAARIVAAVVDLVAASGRREIPVAALAGAAGFGRAPAAAAERLRAGSWAFKSRFSLPLFERDAGAFLEIDATQAGSEGGRDLVVSDAFMRLAFGPGASTCTVATPPRVDRTTTRWIEAVRVAAERGSGLHLAFRCRREGGREIDDLVALLAARGIGVVRVDPDPGRVEAALLEVALHREDGVVVLVGTRCLAAEAAAPFADPDDPARRAVVAPSPFAISARPWLGRLGSVCIWCVAATGDLDPAFHGLLGGCIGPIDYDPSWSRETVADLLPGVDPCGIETLGGCAPDPRDAGAAASTARCLAEGTGMALEEAWLMAAASFAATAGSSPPAAPPPRRFDPRLLACEEDATLLLERAAEAGRGGARILAHGAPGGGKSTFARVLAERMADSMRPAGEVLVVTPGSILARGLGVTERIMETLFARAAGASAGRRGVLLIDELDAMCGVRDPEGASSGNAYLVRTLTDSWLRCFDLHPVVPVVATLNDLKALDAAVLRRFQLALRFGDELAPEAERLAWRVVLEMEPPAGWRPCGASISDFDSARSRCRILGRVDPRSIADAIAKLREARRGVRSPPPPPVVRTAGPVH